MVSPDGTPPESNQPERGRKGLFTGAVLLIAIGFVALGALSSTNQMAVPEPTTTTSTTSTTVNEIEPPIDLDNFTVDQLTRGEPFEWETTLSVVEGFPMALVDHDGSIYLFATDAPNFSAFQSGGLRAWRSGDGLNWEPLGQVIDQSHTITSVSTTAQGLIALEQPKSAALTVWHSDDGTNWEPQHAQVEELDEILTVYPYAVGGTDQVLVVAGNVYVDTLAILGEKLGEAASYGWGTDVLSDGVRFTLYGPLGPLAELSAEEVGLSEEEQQVIIDANASEPANTTVWVNAGGRDWEQTVIPDAHWIDRLVTTPEGEIIAHGWGANNADSWVSRDGLTWEKMPPRVHHYLEAKWGDRLVALSRSGRPSVSVSVGGDDWELIGPDEHFPDPISWWVGAIGAGPGGIALTVGGWDDAMQFEGPAITVQPVTITGPDGTLTIDFESNEYRLETEAGDRTWSGMSLSRSGIEVDLDTHAVQFFDLESGALMASFPLVELMEAQERLMYTGQDDSFRYDAFAFTSDGEEWTIQNLEELGSGEMRQLVLVTDTHVVITGLGSGDFFRPDSPPGFDVWAAEIP